MSSNVNEEQLKLPPSCTQRVYRVDPSDLPLSCPPRGTRVWDTHPRVYLPIKETKQVTCPYCDAKYILNNHE